MSPFPLVVASIAPIIYLCLYRRLVTQLREDPTARENWVARPDKWGKEARLLVESPSRAKRMMLYGDLILALTAGGAVVAFFAQI